MGTINLNNLDIAAIVTLDTPPLAFYSKYALTIGTKSIPLVPYEFLNEAVTENYFDYIFVSGNEGPVIDNLKKLGIEKQKIFNMASISSFYLTYHVRLIRQIMSDISTYRILFTGSSYVRDATDLSCYELPAVNCAASSQDIFYDYEYIKIMLSSSNSHFKYVFIELSPWSFHFDLSKSEAESFLIPGYYLAFKNVHNFHVSNAAMELIFNEQYLNLFETLDKTNYPFDLDLNDLYKWKQSNNHSLDIPARFAARERAEAWNKKRFPLTVSENIKLLKECIKFCREKNAIPIIIIYPKSDIYLRFFSKQMIDEFYYILNKLKIEEKIHIIDYMRWKGVDINDFYNVDHLNSNGAKKVSNAINNYIMKNMQN